MGRIRKITSDKAAKANEKSKAKAMPKDDWDKTFGDEDDTTTVDSTPNGKLDDPTTTHAAAVEPVKAKRGRKPEAEKAPKAAKAPKPPKAPRVKVPKGPKKIDEAALMKQYPLVRAGTLRHEDDGPLKSKISVEINTLGVDMKPDGNKRRVATSDLFQVRHTPEVLIEVRKLRAAERRADREVVNGHKGKA
jgi:hypothetical protein